MKDRFAKLAALTRGAAVIAISATTGCTKNEPPSPPPVAAGTIQHDPATSDPSDPSAPRRKFPIPNAMQPNPAADDPPDASAPRRKFPIPNAMRPGFGWNSPRDGGPLDGGTNSGP